MTDELGKRAAGAAPGAPVGDHLGEAVLTALRARSQSDGDDGGDNEGGGDEDRDEDADAYRHLASCAACRARMASLSKGHNEADSVQRVVDVAKSQASETAKPADVAKSQASETAKPADVAKSDASQDGKPARVITLQRRSIAKPLAMLAAAAVLIFAVSSLFRGSSHRLEIRTRSYAGTMGSGDAAATVASGDANVEIYFESKEDIVAKLIVLDEKGNKLAPVRTFTREGAKLKVVVAPRTFAAHEGKAQAFVIAGSEPIVSATADEAMALPALTQKRLETIAQRQGAWLERVEL